MSHQENLNLIRSKVIEANRNEMLVGTYCGKHKGSDPECDLCKKTMFREPCLVDVLLAIEKHLPQIEGVSGNGFFMQSNGDMEWNFDDEEYPKAAMWDLEKSFEDQSEPTISFLAELLR